LCGQRPTENTSSDGSKSERKQQTFAMREREREKEREGERERERERERNWKLFSIHPVVLVLLPRDRYEKRDKIIFSW
jgi:hypothetical protein